MNFNASLSHTKVNFLIGVLVFFYWFTQVFFYSEALNRFILLGPSIILSGFVLYLLLYKKHLQFKKSSYLLILFFLGSVLTGLYNTEIEIIAATAIFTFPLLAVNESLFSIDVKLINFLYVVTILVGVITFHLGLNELGYLPGHSLLNNQTPWWRVSIFPTSSPTYSGFFSLLVYVYNIRNKSLRGKIFKGLSIYFLLLAGSRTALLLFLAVLFYQYSKNWKTIKYWLPYIVLTIPIIVLTTDFIFTLSESNIGQEYALRGHEYESQEELRGLHRFILWENLFNLYLKSPILGLGSYEFLEYFPYLPSFSESKWLSILASNGIFTVPLFFFFSAKYYLSVKNHQTFKALGLMIMMVSMFYYGSFYNSYNLIYLLNILIMSKVENTNYRFLEGKFWQRQ